MINKSDDFTRRILNFPAIRPCESVSFSIILSSLINLGRVVCDKRSRTFFTNKENVRNSIRLIENLVVCLEEIPNGASGDGNALVLSLSELYFIVQKVNFLLEDCTRDDAKLWMLMNTEKVASQFGVLMRAIGVALDVMPLEGVQVADEVIELVEFVKKQAFRAKFEAPLEDRRVLEKVMIILDQFENGVAPKSCDLKGVLEYLGIRIWGECNVEIKFLECEIRNEVLTSEQRDLGLLSSLMAFMIYCRCTMFRYVDNAGRKQSDMGCSSEVIRCLNVDDFRCPITLEIMADPVTIASGHTYDRSSIQKWFSSGNHTCPKTGERLMCTAIVPNLALKRLIRRCCMENGVPFAESSRRSSRAVDNGSLAAKQAMKLLADFLVGKIVAGESDEQNKAAYEIRLLTKSSSFNRSCLVECCAVPPLLNLLASKNPAIQENAIAALLNISKCSESKRIMIENGGLALIVDVLREGIKMEARQHAAGALFYLASVEEYRKMIGKIPYAIPGLVELILDGTDRGKKNALVTIFGLIMCPENHWRVLAAGVVPVLVDLLTSSEREDLTTDCLAVLATLAEKFDGTMAIISAGALPIIVEVLSFSNSNAAKEYCISLLLALCINDEADVVPVLVKNQSLMGPLYSLLTDGTSRASKKASSLIRILHAFNEKNSSGMLVQAFSRDQFVHVW